MNKLRAHDLREKKKEELLKKLEEQKSELSSLRVSFFGIGSKILF